MAIQAADNLAAAAFGGSQACSRRRMKQLVTEVIILARTDYGEADRILTVLSPEYGKLRLLAKGVRRVKSKLAGGIELFSVSVRRCKCMENNRDFTPVVIRTKFLQERDAVMR